MFLEPKISCYLPIALAIDLLNKGTFLVSLIASSFLKLSIIVLGLTLPMIFNDELLLLFPGLLVLVEIADKAGEWFISAIVIADWWKLGGAFS